jgi:uncharacterized protein
MDTKFEVNRDEAGQFRFKLIAANGLTIAVSQGYTTKENAMNGIASVKENAAKAVIDDRTT